MHKLTLRSSLGDTFTKVVSQTSMGICRHVLRKSSVDAVIISYKSAQSSYIDRIALKAKTLYNYFSD